MPSLTTGPFTTDSNATGSQLAMVQDAVNNNTTPGWNAGSVVGGAVATGSVVPGYAFSKVQPLNWNQLFPYQLMVYDTSTGGFDDRWSFTLPFSPKSITISMPFTEEASVSLGGVILETNGAPFRNISFSGTFGVLPLKGSGPVFQNSLLNALAGGTINNAVSTINTIGSAVSALTGTPVGKSNLIDLTDTKIQNSTGYIQFHILRMFLETYTAIRSTAEGKTLRLALAIWKDNTVYLVSPRDYTTNKSFTRPNSWDYSFQLKAYGRVDPKGMAPSAYPVAANSVSSPDVLSKVLTEVTAAQNVMLGLQDTIKAVRTDVDHILNIASQVSYFIKDALGVAVTVADLPQGIRLDCINAIVSNWNTIRNSVIQSSEAMSNIKQQTIDALDTASIQQNYLSATGGPATSSPLYKKLGGPGINTQLNSNTVSQSGQSSSVSTALSSDSAQGFALCSLVQPGQLNLSPALQHKIAGATNIIRQLQRQDFETMRDQVQTFQDNYALACGAGDATYSTTFGLPPPNTTNTPSDLDFDVMFALNQLTMQLNAMAATNAVDKNVVDPMTLVAGMASKANIAFKIPQSKFLVPFPYGTTLEWLAQRYLGDSGRWMEIVILNGLREPYIDEVGFTLPFLANGNFNQIVVSSSTNLYLNQTLTVYSNSVAPIQCHILNIVPISSTQTVLTVDNNTMSLYTLGSSATVQAYLPDTVNSSKLIFIPSDVPLPDDGEFSGKQIPDITQLTSLSSIGGSDFLLNSSNDLVVTPGGDLVMATGLTNIIQQARIYLGTPKGTLIHHPDIGFGISAGTSLADIKASDILAAINSTFAQDPTYNGVNYSSVAINGPVTTVNVGVSIKGFSQSLPISFNINQ